MKTWRAAAAAAVLWTAALSGPASAERSPPIQMASISPGGDMLAFVSTSGQKRRVLVYRLDGRMIASLGTGPQEIRDLRWAGPEHLVITALFQSTLPGAGATGARYYGVVGFNTRTKRFASLFNPPAEIRPTGWRTQKKAERTTGFVVAEPVPAQGGRPALFVTTLNLSGSCSFDLYHVDFGSGDRQVHSRGASATRFWAVTPQGEVLARSDAGAGTERLLVKHGGEWRPADVHPAAVLLGLGRTPDSLLLTAPDGPEDRKLVEIYPDGRAPVTLSPNGSVDPSPVHDPASGLMVGLLHGLKVKRYVFYRPELETAWRAAESVFPGQNVMLTSWTPDFAKMVVYVEEPEGPRYYLVDMPAKRADALARAFTEADPEGTVENNTFDISEEMREQSLAGVQNVKSVCGAIREQGLPKDVRDLLNGRRNAESPEERAARTGGP